jgi:hypothetical protein
MALLVGADNAALESLSLLLLADSSGRVGLHPVPQRPVIAGSNAILTAACGITNGCPDFIDGAPYAFNYATDMIDAECLDFDVYGAGESERSPVATSTQMQNYAFTTSA